MNVVKYLAIALLLAVFSGCASYPISKEYRKQASQIPLNQVKADPVGTRGKIVIWGGRILSVANNAQGGSIYILCFPADEDGQPVQEAPSPGRFIAVGTGFLDPEVFPQGRLITVAGQIDGVRTELLQNVQYTYPVLQIGETHIWPSEPQGSYYPYYGYYPPYWGWGWGWGPGWWGWWGAPYYYGGYYYHGGYHGSYHGVVGGAVHGGGSGGSFHGSVSGGGGSFHGGGGGGGGGHGH